MNAHLVWYRNDLRTHDHAPLQNACQQARNEGAGVLAFYVVDPFWFGRTTFGFDRIGPHRRRFLLESLQDLQARLSDAGAMLTVLRGDTEQTVARLFDSVSPATIRFHHEFSPEERVIEDKVIQLAEARKIPVQVSAASTLYDQDDFPFSIGETPAVFSKFRRIVEKKCHPQEPLGKVTLVPTNGLPDEAPKGSVRLEDVPEFQSANDAPTLTGVLDFRGGESSGGKRIQEYFWETDSLRRYKETRNGMLEANDSSKFSPWLAFGCLSARTIAMEVRRYESERVANDSTYWMIFELLWRDYFAFMVAKHGNHVFQVAGLQRKRMPWNQDEEVFELWKIGQTGVPLIDANMRELSKTGFMSNRGRQNVASFLTKNLSIDWRMGAEWFESRLIDYDPCSNYGNWNYVAGVGNDPRSSRWFNPIKQSKDYDPDGAYVRHWCPELIDVPTSHVHQPWKMSAEQQRESACRIGDDYPKPIVDLTTNVIPNNRSLHGVE